MTDNRVPDPTSLQGFDRLEPASWTLARVEANGRLLTTACPECGAMPIEKEWNQLGGVVVEPNHRSDCPILLRAVEQPKTRTETPRNAPPRDESGR